MWKRIQKHIEAHKQKVHSQFYMTMHVKVTQIVEMDSS